MPVQTPPSPLPCPDLFSAFNAYHIMWIYAMFDLPVKTKEERKRANQFRKNLLKDGFERLQLSVYVRHCPSRENVDVHKARIRAFLPPRGHVSIIVITDKQYAQMEIFYHPGAHSRRSKAPRDAPGQLTLF